MKLSEFIDEVIKIIPTPRRWNKLGTHGGIHGERSCLWGAMMGVKMPDGVRIIPDQTWRTSQLRDQYIQQIDLLVPEKYKDAYYAESDFGQELRMIAFNDHHKTQHRDVLAFLHMARERAEAKELWLDLAASAKSSAKQAKREARLAKFDELRAQMKANREQAKKEKEENV